MASDSITYSFEFDGLERQFILDLPDSYNAQEPLPLVLNMHGGGGSAEGHQGYSAFSSVANEHNWIVVYPNAIDHLWEAGRVGPDRRDDVGFLSTLVDVVAANYKVDLSRVYTMGFSNGGFMSYRLGCEIDERIAAVGSVSGLMYQGVFKSCSPSGPVPVIHIHGTRDRIIPFEGIRFLYPSAMDIMAFWSGVNGCSAAVEHQAMPNPVAKDLSTVEYFHKADCNENAEIELYQVENGGHTWPGASPLPRFGLTNQDINASELVADFFSRHQIPADQVLLPAPGETLDGEPLPELRQVSVK